MCHKNSKKVAISCNILCLKNVYILYSVLKFTLQRDSPEIVKLVRDLILKTLLTPIQGGLCLVYGLSSLLNFFECHFCSGRGRYFSLSSRAGFSFSYPPSISLQSSAFWHALCLFGCKYKTCHMNARNETIFFCQLPQSVIYCHYNFFHKKQEEKEKIFLIPPILPFMVKV